MPARFGVLLNGLESAARRTEIARDTLLSDFYRPESALNAARQVVCGECLDCLAAEDEGMDLVIPVRYGGLGFRVPSTTPTSEVPFKRSITSLLARYTNIDTLCVGNEYPSTLFLDEDVTPAQYENEVRWVKEAVAGACNVADSGVTYGHVAAARLQAYADAGDQAGALTYAQQTYGQEALGSYVFSTYADVSAFLTENATTIQRVEDFLSAGINGGITHRNFHWYGEVHAALVSTITWLKTAGLPVICSEVGQRNTNTGQTTLIAGAMRTNDVKRVIWYSAFGKPARPLVDADGKLTPIGEAYVAIVRLG